MNESFIESVQSKPEAAPTGPELEQMLRHGEAFFNRILAMDRTLDITNIDVDALLNPYRKQPAPDLERSLFMFQQRFLTLCERFAEADAMQERELRALIAQGEAKAGFVETTPASDSDKEAFLKTYPDADVSGLTETDIGFPKFPGTNGRKTVQATYHDAANGKAYGAKFSQVPVSTREYIAISHLAEVICVDILSAFSSRGFCPQELRGHIAAAIVASSDARRAHFAAR